MWVWWDGAIRRWKCWVSAVVFKWFSVSTMRPKVCQENIFLLTPPAAAFWHKILTLLSECRSRKADSSAQAMFFFLSIFWPILVLIAALVSCSCTMFCLLLLYPSASRFGMLCIKRCSSAYLSCNQWFFELMLSSCHLEATWPLSSDHWDQLDLFSQRTAAHWVFFLFEIILCNP